MSNSRAKWLSGSLFAVSITFKWQKIPRSQLLQCYSFISSFLDTDKRSSFFCLRTLLHSLRPVSVDDTIICNCFVSIYLKMSELVQPCGQGSQLRVRNYVTVLWVKRRPEAKIGTNTSVCFIDLAEQKCVHHKYVVGCNLC